MHKRDRTEAKVKSLPLSWRVLLVFAGLTLGLAITSCYQVIGVLAQKRNPALALSIQPNNAVANVRISDIALAALTTESDFEREIGGYARRSFLTQGLNAPAVRQFAVLALLSGEEGRARELFAAAEQISRRDVAISLYQYELAYRTGRIEEAVKQFDTAARVSRRGREQLIPRAVELLSDEAWREGLSRELLEQPDWLADFWSAAISSPERVSEVAQLRLALPANERVASGNVTRVIIRNVLREGDIASAIELYSHVVGPGVAARQMGSNINFTSGDWPPFSWEIVSDVDALANATEDGRQLQFSVLSNAAPKLLARRLMKFAPGRYTLSTQVSNEEDLPKGMISLIVTCARTNKEIGSIDLGASAGGGQLSRNLMIPSGCTEQWYRLESRSNASSFIYSGTLTAPQLVSISAN